MNTREKVRQYAIQHLLEHGDWPSVPQLQKNLAPISSDDLEAALQEARADIASRLEVTTRFPEMPAAVMESAFAFYETVRRETDSLCSKHQQELQDNRRLRESSQRENEARADRAAQRIAELEKELRSADETRMNHAREIQQLNLEIKRLNAQLDQERLQARHRLEQQGREKLEIENQAARDRRQFEEQERRLQERIGTDSNRSQSEINQLSQRLGKQEQQRRDLEKQLQQQESLQKSLAKQLQQEKSGRQQEQEARQQAENRLQKANAENSRERQQASVTQEKLGSALRENERLQQLLEDLRKVHQSDQQQRQKLQQQNQQLQQDTSALKSELRQLERLQSGKPAAGKSSTGKTNGHGSSKRRAKGSAKSSASR